MNRFVLSAPVCLVLASSAMASDPVAFLFDRSASATIHMTGPAAGMIDLRPDGEINRLRYQSFWFRTPGMENEANVGTLGLLGLQTTDTNPFVDPSADTASALYSSGSFTIETVWQLRGGPLGSDRADVGETITITNTQVTAGLVISFFQYSNFILSDGQVPADVLTISGAGNNTASQFGNAGFVSETVVTPAPSFYKAGDAAALLALLTNGSVDNMDNTGSPAGPGDVAWIYQWNFNIPLGGSVIISKDKSIVPTPGAVALLSLGGLIAGRRRRA